MLNQDIDTLKSVINLIELMRNDPDNPRLSLIDLAILLALNQRYSASKPDLSEIINGDRTAFSSSLDKPIGRLEDQGLLTSYYDDEAATKLKQAKVTYRLTAGGVNFLKSCT